MGIEAKIKHQVSKSIKQYNMFSRKDKILLGVSGGKDSFALAWILKKLNYPFSALFIDLEIPHFSSISLQTTKNFLKNLQIPLIEVSLKQELGYSMQEAKKDYPNNLCALCGTLKRKIFNVITKKVEFDVFCTGHNLEDEAENLLADNLRWDWEYMKKCSPVLKASHGFVKRAKPFFSTKESDILQLVQEKNIPFLKSPCPYSVKGSRHKYKAVLHSLESFFPGGVAGYYFQFLKKSSFLKAIPEKDLILRPCQSCGESTTQTHCKACLIISKQWKRG